MFAASCIGVALLVVCLEFLRRIGNDYDAAILRKFRQHVSVRAAQIHATNILESATSGPQFVTFRATPLQQLTRAVIYAVTFGVVYILMLLAMY
jgi:solute carrier family 31 (copper transporter), member 1